MYTHLSFGHVTQWKESKLVTFVLGANNKLNLKLNLNGQWLAQLTALL